MKLRLYIPATLLAVVIMNCSVDKKKYSDEEEKERIRMLYPGWVDRFMETKDPADYFKTVSDDFVLLGCGFDPITSRDTIESDVRKIIDSDLNIKIADCQSHEIIIRDDIAIHRYTCFEVITSKSDTVGRRMGFNYLDILTKTSDDEWKIHMHMATEKQ